MPTPPVNDLWPPDLLGGEHTPTPIGILRQQGEALGARTHNFVLGEVETSPDSNGTMFTHSLMLVAPFLRYRKPLLKVYHAVLPFPAEVVEGDLTRTSDKEPWRQKVNDENELRDRLQEFFNEARVKTLIRSVINMSNDVAPEEG
jgi:hypothetical protein